MTWYARVALFLDTRLYGAHTTAADSLRYGAPVLTLQGDRFANRVSSSLLEALDEDAAAADDDYHGHGHAHADEDQLLMMRTSRVSLTTQLITHSIQSYQSQAERLLRRADLLPLLRRRLRPAAGGAMRAAFDYRLTAARLERAYRAMWEVRAATDGAVAGGIVVQPDSETGSGCQRCSCADAGRG